jgi:stress response protein YsnF
MRDAGQRERDTSDKKTSVPIVEEQIVVGSCEIVTGRTIISKKVEEREEVIDLSLSSENYRAERISINLTVNNPPSVRHVGDTMIIPLLEEVAVVKKQLVLREELRITRLSTELRRSQPVTLKRETVDVLMVPPQQGNTDEFDGSGVVPMAKTIVGLFDNQQKAQTVIQELANAGLRQSEIHCITRNDSTASRQQ